MLLVLNRPALPQSQRAQLKRLGSRLGSSFALAFEPEVSIAKARNKALDWALEEGLNWLAFIDSDCWPQPDWLSRLMLCARHTGAAVVAGDADIRPDSQPSRFVPSNTWGKGSYSSWHFVGKNELNTAFTRNVVFRVDMVPSVRSGSLRFTEFLGSQGGSDLLFFKEIHSQGFKIAFCRSALVVENYSGERLRFRWHFKRTVRNTQLALLRGERVSDLFRQRFRRASSQEIAASERPERTTHLLSTQPWLFQALGRMGLFVAAGIGLLAFKLDFRYSSYSDSWSRCR